MAEKINLFELDIDMDKAIADTKRMAEEVELLKAQTQKAKKEQGESSEEYQQYSAALKGAQGDLRTQQKLIQNVSQANNAQTGSIEEMRKQLAVVSVQWARLSQEERENEDIGGKLSKQKKELTDALKAEEKATGDTRRNVGNYGESMRELVPVYGRAEAARKTFTTGLNVLAKHPIILAITAIVAALVGLFKAMQRNEEFSDKLAKAWGMLSAVLDVLIEGVIQAGKFIIDMFSSVEGESSGFVKMLNTIKDAIVSVFEDPKEAILSLWNFIEQNFINRFNGLIKFVQSAGAVIGKGLKGDFDGAGEAAKEAGKAFAEMGTGVKFEDIEAGARKVGDAVQGIVGGIKEMSNELQQAAIDAGAIEDLKVRIRKNQIDITNSTAQQTVELARARLIEADTTKEVEERLKAVRQAVAIETQRNEAQLEHQRLIVQLKEAELAATPELQRTDEQRLAIADERLKLAEMEAQSLNFRREMVTKIATLETQMNKEKAAALAEVVDADIEAIEKELQAEEELLAKKLELSNEAIAQAEEERMRRAEAARANYENELIMLENNEIAKLEKEREYLQLKKEQEIEFAEAIGADTAIINQKYAEFERQIENEKIQAKLGLQQQFAGNLAQIFGENTKVGKMAAAAETTINAFKAAQGAYSALAPIPIVGPVLGAGAAAAALKSGFDNVKKIYAVKSGLPGEGGGGSAGGAGGSAAGGAASVVPSMGQGLASRQSSANQADAVKDGVSKALKETPLQPTLVQDDVTAAQSNDARRTETATI